MSRQDLWQRLSTKKNTGTSYEHPIGFWLGIMVTTIGVLMQLPMYFMAKEDHYHLAGMPMTVRHVR